MLKVLLRSRMEALLSVLTGASRTKKAQSKGKLIGFAVLMLLSLFSLGTLFARIFEVLAEPLAMLGLGWLYFGMAVVLSFGLMLVGNVILAKYQLFEARDNDLLLSMPIPPIDILLSRLFLLYVLAVGIMLLSGGGVLVLGRIGVNPVIGKPIVDILLYFVSYRLQQKWVFAEEKE